MYYIMRSKTKEDCVKKFLESKYRDYVDTIYDIAANTIGSVFLEHYEKFDRRIHWDELTKVTKFTDFLITNDILNPFTRENLYNKL